MPRRSTSHPLDAIRRQLGRVRWRHDLREAQRALYLLVAVGGTAGTVALLLALCGSVRLFAYGSAGVAGLALLTVGLLGRDARRRLLGTARAAAWADRRGSLEGRLATLLEIAGRDPGAPAADHGAPSGGGPGAPPATPGAGGGRPSLLARLQERIRERVWGPSWEPPGDATRSADAGRGGPKGNAHATSDADAERTGTVPTVGSGSRQELARVARAARRTNRGNREGKEASGEASPPERGSGADDEPEQTGTDGAASGAGTATSPDLFGPPTGRRAGGGETFA